jgi:hypothetical protein
MTLFLGIALGLVALWFVVKFVFKVAGCAIHVLLLAALVALALHFVH